ILVDLPNGKRAIGTKWVYKNKKDERGLLIKNKARLVAQGYTQEEGIDYDEVFSLVARIECQKDLSTRPRRIVKLWCCNPPYQSTSKNKKQEYVKQVDKKEDRKKRNMSKVKCYNCKKECHFAKDCKKEKAKDYNYYKTKMLLAKKDSDEEVLLAEDQAWME
ncbi:ribonuclease H-like domain-containing protein, partial [Tanacetum coccineum]